VRKRVSGAQEDANVHSEYQQDDAASGAGASRSARLWGGTMIAAMRVAQCRYCVDGTAYVIHIPLAAWSAVMGNPEESVQSQLRRQGCKALSKFWGVQITTLTQAKLPDARRRAVLQALQLVQSGKRAKANGPGGALVFTSAPNKLLMFLLSNCCVYHAIGGNASLGGPPPMNESESVSNSDAPEYSPFAAASSAQGDKKRGSTASTPAGKRSATASVAGLAKLAAASSATASAASSDGALTVVASDSVAVEVPFDFAWQLDPASAAASAASWNDDWLLDPEALEASWAASY